MNKLLIITSLFILFSCNQTNEDSGNDMESRVEVYNEFDKNNHLQPDFEKTKFDTLHGWSLGWEILAPINIAKSEDDEKELSKRFSPGQKALYFFWYLDAQVTNGGFVQFYWNGYGKYVPTIKEGLKLIGDNELLELLDKADKEFNSNKNKFNEQRENGDWKPLYDSLKFEEYDNKYYKIHDKTMELLEKYIRNHPDEFVRLK